ncbi:efflux transporter outer membrane subunit [Hydrogenophaga sp.]|uniref:efflux transporter outer membrane subunit n=1 Tax=Hydrogenophaga sp. TaxID=1904254 RepID=UPI002639A087|nr:efflux transporter outer membrane subunit [Hydrogenophaga sp.]MDM7949412.1 efflux transporter outer membrane subunit [Hydrogenophaga sp.]
MPYAARASHKNSVGLIVLFALGACSSVGPDYARPPLSLQADWSTPAGLRPVISANDETTFWGSFDDPVLSELLQFAQANNLTLQTAAAQVAQAEAVLRGTLASALPAAQLSAGSTYSQPDLASTLRGTQEGSTAHQVLGQVSWEIDFWGTQRRATEVDAASLRSSQAAYRAANVSIKASVAATYCNVRLYEQRLAVAQANLAQQQESLRIAEARFRLGAASELDYRQAQTQHAQTLAQLPAIRQSLATFQHALSVLLGSPPDRFAREHPMTHGLPRAPKAAAAGLPRDLLRRRPDVMQAEAVAMAQSARIGQAEAALYPSFTLGGSFGFSTTDSVSDLFRWDNRTLSAGLGLVLPLFDRERIKAQVQVQDSLFKQAMLAYQNQVLKAQQEVEDAMSAIMEYTEQVAQLSAAEAAASRSAELAGARYRSGQTDYTTVASAEQARLQTSDARVQAQGALLQAHISAWRALGGLEQDASSGGAQP